MSQYVSAQISTQDRFNQCEAPIFYKSEPYNFNLTGDMEKDPREPYINRTEPIEGELKFTINLDEDDWPSTEEEEGYINLLTSPGMDEGYVNLLNSSVETSRKESSLFQGVGTKVSNFLSSVLGMAKCK